MYTLGLDISKNCTGWAVHDGVAPLAWGHFAVADHADMYAHVGAIITQYGPTAVNYERNYVGPNAAVSLQLATYVGAALAACGVLTVVGYMPGVWRAMAARQHGIAIRARPRPAAKADAVAAVATLYAATVTHDEAEAILLASL